MGSIVPRALLISLTLIVLLCLTLTPKFVSGARIGIADDARLARDLAAMLAAQGYQVEIRPLNRIFEYVVARQEGCRLVATALQDDGYYRDRFEAAFARFGPTRYYYRSNHGGGYPRVTPILEDHLQRWSFRFGIVAPRPAVIAVAASSACRVQTTPWASLRIWPIAQTASPGE